MVSRYRNIWQCDVIFFDTTDTRHWFKQKNFPTNLATAENDEAGMGMLWTHESRIDTSHASLGGYPLKTESVVAQSNIMLLIDDGATLNSFLIDVPRWSCLGR